MNSYSRRSFLKSSALLGIGALSLSNMVLTVPSQTFKRNFRICLMPWAIGINANPVLQFDYAKKWGYEAISPDGNFFLNTSEDEMNKLLEGMKQADITWGASTLPVDFRKDEQTFTKDMEELPNIAKALHNYEVDRITTYILPTHAERTYIENYRIHTKRLQEIAKILADNNIKLGLEYVGPKTFWTRNKFPFIHTLSETMNLISDLRSENVGIVLDSFHWYTANDSIESLSNLSDDQIIACDLNDANAERTREEQIDGERELPTATGKINLKSFLETLVQIGYSGTIRAEPFNQAINELDDEEALALTIKHMRAAVDLLEE